MGGACFVSTQPVRLHGRDERGFAIGSEAAREAARLYAAAERREGSAVEPREPRKRKGGWPVIAPEVALMEPAWSLGEELVDQGRRFRDRERARKAAETLGVPVPHWARPGRHEITKEHRENIRAASLRRYQR